MGTAGVILAFISLSSLPFRASAADGTATPALTTTFTPPVTCTQQHLTILQRLQYQIWLNHPLPVTQTPMSDCYPSEVYSSFSADGGFGITRTGSATVPALSPLVCPQGYDTVLQATGGYVACCPSSYLLAPPTSTLTSSRPALGGTCYSPLNTAVIVTAYDSSSITATATWSPSVSGAQAYAYVIDGFTAPSTTSATPATTASSSAPSQAPPSSSANPAPPSSKGLSGGAIAGIVIGSVAFVAILLGLALFLLRKRRSKSGKAATTLGGEEKGPSNEKEGPLYGAQEMPLAVERSEMDGNAKKVVPAINSPAAELDGEGTTIGRGW